MNTDRVEDLEPIPQTKLNSTKIVTIKLKVATVSHLVVWYTRNQTSRVSSAISLQIAPPFSRLHLLLIHHVLQSK